MSENERLSDEECAALADVLAWDALQDHLFGAAPGHWTWDEAFGSWRSWHTLAKARVQMARAR